MTIFPHRHPLPALTWGEDRIAPNLLQRLISDMHHSLRVFAGETDDIAQLENT